MVSKIVPDKVKYDIERKETKKLTYEQCYDIELKKFKEEAENIVFHKNSRID